MTIADEPRPIDPAASAAAGHPIWEGLRRFDFDAPAAEAQTGGPAVRPFSRRLAEEQGWSPGFTTRVLDEYRRFLFLCVGAGHPVCPSEEVDAAWHLHLTFTRSYWGDLCGSVLRTPLHHDASGGGPAEGRKHREMYRRTLASYRTAFGAEPPADIWPPCWRRFDARSRRRSVDLADHWVVPRPRWWPKSGAVGASLATVPLVAIGPLFADGLGPFDLRGPEFLLLYGGAWLVILVATLLLRGARRDVPTTDDRELAGEEIACLARGPRPAIRATVAGLLDAGELEGETRSRWSIHPGSFFLSATGTGANLDGVVARTVREACPAPGRSLADVERDPRVIDAAERVRRRLQEGGWLVDDDRVWTMRWIPVGAFSLLLLAGLAKIGIGMSRHRPVEFLVGSCIVTVVSIVWAARPPRTSHAADRFLATLKRQRGGTPAADPADLVLLAGLFGASALGTERLARYRKVWQSGAPEGGNGGCGAGVSAGGCGGGGGDGGGGCGGGGCGGCGGGGD